MRPGFTYMLRRLSEHEKSTAQIGGNYLIKHFDVDIGYSSKRHDARTVHHDVDPAESIQRFFEKIFHLAGARNIRLNGYGPAAGQCDLVNRVLCLASLARIVHDDGEAVARQP